MITEINFFMYSKYENSAVAYLDPILLYNIVFSLLFGPLTLSDAGVGT